MSDILVKALNKKETIRFMAVSSTDLVQHANKMFHCAPTSAAALGRVLTMTSLLGAQLKGENEQVVVKINGGGPAGTIMAIGHKNGTVKGFIGDPSLYLTYNDSGKLAVGKIVGTNGYLTVSRESKDHDPFTSSVQLQTGEIGDDFAYYFALSEQVPSVVSLGVLVDPDGNVSAAGGLLIQLMPGHSEDDIVYVENLLKDLSPISTLIHEGKSAKDIVLSLDSDAQILETNPVYYHCDCSKDKFYGALSLLKKDELTHLLTEENGVIEMKCSFCDRVQSFTKEDLKDLLDA